MNLKLHTFFRFCFALLASVFLLLAGSEALASDITQTNAPHRPISDSPFSVSEGGQYGALNHWGHQHEGVDMGMTNATLYAPTDGTAEFYGGGGFGYYIKFTPARSVDSDGQCAIIFGDINGYMTNEVGEFGVDDQVRDYDGSALLYGNNSQFLKSKTFNAGEPMAYIRGFPQEYADGDHLHLEYWVNGWKNGSVGGGSCTDPVQLLMWLGMDIGNYMFSDQSKPETGITFANMADSLGTFFSRLLKYFIDKSNEAYPNLFDVAFGLLLILCLVDLVLPIILSGMVVSPPVLVRKILKYSGIMGFAYVFPKFVDTFLLGFATSAAQTAAGDSTLLLANFETPQLLLQKAAFLITPLLSRVEHFGVYDIISQLGTIFFIYVCAFAVLIAFCFFSFYVMLTLLEFYISAGLCIATVPFGSLGLTKFTTEGAIGHLVSSAIKYFFVAFFLFLCVSVINNVKPVESFTGGTIDIDLPDYGREAMIQTAEDGSIDYSKVIAQYPRAVHVIRAAEECGISPSVALAIFLQESSGGTADVGANIMQVDPRNDVAVLPPAYSDRKEWGPGPRWKIDQIFPEHDTDPDENCRAAMAILYDKIAGQNGNLIMGIKAYNSMDPSVGDPHYLEHVNVWYIQLTGHSLPINRHMAITAEQLETYVHVSTNLVVIVIISCLTVEGVIGYFKGPIKI